MICNFLFQNTFGDIYIPEEFEPPALQKIPQLTSRSHGVKSGSVEVVDSKTIRIPEFSYDGTATRKLNCSLRLLFYRFILHFHLFQVLISGLALDHNQRRRDLKSLTSMDSKLL